MIERDVNVVPSSPASSHETKAFAFQVVHEGRVVAEAPVVIHDLEAALETVEMTLVNSPDLRDEVCKILTFLWSAKKNYGGTFTGVYLQSSDQRATAVTETGDRSMSV